MTVRGDICDIAPLREWQVVVNRVMSWVFITNTKQCKNTAVPIMIIENETVYATPVY